MQIADCKVGLQADDFRGGGSCLLHPAKLSVAGGQSRHHCGHGGSGAAYLFHTVTKLLELGIRDRNLWRLQQWWRTRSRACTPSGAAPQAFPR
jgi:cation transport regulator ChaC